MTQIFSVIAPLFLIILSGAVLQRSRAIGDNWSSVLNEYALNVGFPVLIFTSLLKTPLSFSEHAPLIAVNSIFILAGFLFAFIAGKLLRMEIQMIRTLYLCLVFGNVAYLGIPVLTQVWGDAILPTASVIVAVYLFWIFTVGIGFLDFTRQEKREDMLKDVLRNLLKNPLLLSVFFGFVVAGLGIRFPDMIMTSLNMITASVTPVVLLVIGLFIGKSNLGRLTEWIPVFIFSCVILVVMPAIFYFAIRLAGLLPSQFSSSITEAAMPVAITPFALADRYGLNKEFIARSIVLSTILSVISLPFWISIL
ncbi:AEC family transporter [bacterium]|nr:AEC family transporter [bacterium]